jgi:hypothetical protein
MLSNPLKQPGLRSERADANPRKYMTIDIMQTTAYSDAAEAAERGLE